MNRHGYDVAMTGAEERQRLLDAGGHWRWHLLGFRGPRAAKRKYAKRPPAYAAPCGP